MRYPIFIYLFFLLQGHHSQAQEVMGVTKNSILIGQSAAFKGSSNSLGSELWRGAQAYFDFINSKGGINGRSIKVLSLNDSYDGDKTIANTISLIKKHQVFTLFGYVGTPTIVKALPVIQKFSKEGVVLFSNFTGAQPQRELPHRDYVFNIRSSYRQETAGLIDNLVKLGYKKIGIFIQHDAYGRSGADGVERALKKHGLEITAEATYKRGAIYSDSMMEQVNILKNKQVEAVISVGSYAACAAFIRDSRKSRIQWPIANVSFVGAEALLRLVKETERKEKITLTNHLINSQVVPLWDDTSYPLVREYRELMDKFPNDIAMELSDSNYKPSRYSFVSLEGFLNAKVLVLALKKASPKLTRKSFIMAIQSLNNVDIGLNDKIKFSKSKHQALDTVFYTTVKNGKYASITNWSFLKP